MSNQKPLTENEIISKFEELDQKIASINNHIRELRNDLRILPELRNDLKILQNNQKIQEENLTALTTNHNKKFKILREILNAIRDGRSDLKELLRNNNPDTFLPDFIPPRV